jgi:hypothetical protein
MTVLFVVRVKFKLMLTNRKKLKDNFYGNNLLFEQIFNASI